MQNGTVTGFTQAHALVHSDMVVTLCFTTSE